MLKLKLQFFGGRGASSASGKGSGGSSDPDGLPFNRGAEINPETAVENVNKHNYNTDRNYRINCQRCVWAYEMQRRGYDVEAKPSFAGDDLPRGGNWMDISQNGRGTLTREYIGAHWGQANSIKTEVTNATDVMRGWGEGSRGIVRVAWSGSNSGHVFNVEYKNGKIIAYDAQNGTKHTSLNAALKGTKRGYTQLVRSDDVKFNPNEVSKYVKERGKK